MGDDTGDGDDTRTRLRETALRLFGTMGVLRTPTREILEEAGLRNPSAISYYFGSKAELVDDLATEVITDAWPLIQLQVDLAADATPSVTQWTEAAVDAGVRLISTERGCWLACLWWEYNGYLFPDAFEEFLESGVPLAVHWQEAIGRVFTDLPLLVAVDRNVVAVRTIEWMIARRARRVLTGEPSPAVLGDRLEDFRDGVLEVALPVLTGPSRFTTR